MVPQTLINRFFRENINPIIFFSKSKLEMLDINSSALQLFGYKRSELIEKCISILLTKESFQLVQERIAQRAVDEISLSLNFIKRDNVHFPKNVYLQELQYRNQTFLSMELKSELKTVDSIDYFNDALFSLLDDIPSALIIADFSEMLNSLAALNITNKKPLMRYLKSNQSILSEILDQIRIIHINQSVYELYDVNSEEECDDKISSFLHNLQIEKVVDMFYALLNQKSEIYINAIDTKMTGKLFYVKIHIQLLKNFHTDYDRVMIQISDLTDYHKVEESIKRLENRYQAIFQSSEIGIAIISSSFRVIEVNESLIEMSGLKPEVIRGLRIKDFIKSADSEQIQQSLTNIFSEKNEFFQKQVLITDANLNEKWWKFTVSLIKEEKGKSNFAIALIEDITEQKIIERERENLFDEVNKARKRLESLTKFLLNAQEAERGNISRELHDEVGQVLTAINIELQSILKLGPSKKIKVHIAEGTKLVDYAIQKTKNLSINLRPSMLDDLGLISAVRWFLKKEQQRTNLNIMFSADTETTRYRSEIEITCYRIIQESLTNIMRHANAKNVWVNIVEEKERIKLEIKDDGVGFDPEEVFTKLHEGKSMGLISMMERVELIGGKIDFESNIKERGTSIIIHIPKNYYVKG